ncbi:MAG: hypothetical protein KIT58_02235 [Planctomycetota bacterium]|nr:hypothetical protein [Planctomycetota bacterium]
MTPVLTGDEPPGDLSIMPAHVFEGVLHEYPDALEERTAGLERRLRLGVADDDERRELEAIQRLHDPDGSSGPEPDSDTLDLAPEDGDTTTAAPATEPGSADEASEDALPDPVTDLPPPLDAPPPDDDAHIASKNEVGCFIIVQRKARRLVLSDGTIIDFGEAVAVWSSLLTIIESRRKHPDGGWTKAPAQKGHRDDIIRRIREAGLPPERVIERAGSRWRLAAPPKFAQPAPSEPTGGTG